MSRKQRPSTSKRAARRRIPLVCLGLALGFAAATWASAGVGQWTSTGPDGGAVTALAISPANPSNVYAGTSAGLFVSEDAGASWTLSSGVEPGVVSIAIDDTGRVLYAVAGHWIYASTDGGATWARRAGFYTPLVLGIDPGNPSTLYFGTAEGLVYRSANGGKSYSSGSAAGLVAITSVAVLPGTATTAYQAGSTGVFKTVDGGLSWTALTSLDAALGPKSDNQYFVAINPGDPQRLYAARSSETGSHLCSSTYGGTGWNCGGNLFSSVTGLAFDPNGTATIYAATTGGFYKSVDRGATWLARSTKLPGAPNAVAVTQDGSVVFAGTSAGAFRSTDYADHWTASGSGIRATAILALGSATSGPARLFAGSSSGLFRRDGDGDWNALAVADPKSFFEIAAIAVSPGDSATAYAGGNLGVLKTGDAFDHGSLSPLTFPVNALAIDPTAPTNVYAGTGGGFEHQGNVSKSTDGGATWNPTSLAHEVYSLIIDPRHPSTLYAGTDYDLGYYTSGGGIFKSTDAGETWTRTDKRFGNRILALAIDPRDSSTIYAGEGFLGVYKSIDGGTTWNSASSDSFHDVYALLADPVVPGRLFAGTEAGVMQSQNGGQTWTRLGVGLPALPVTSLAIEPDGSALHAGTAGAGVYDYALSARGPCAAGSLCLLGNRFEVTLFATDSGRGLTSSGTAVAQTDRFGYFSLPDFTGDAALPEVLVKMVDASATSFKSFWFFYSGLTSLPYTVSVRDTITGQIRTYDSDGYCGGADTSGFKADSATSATSVETEGIGALSASGTELSLLSNRFRITLSATDSHRNKTSDGVAIPQDDRFGYFSLPAFTGDESFPEVFVKMVDGRSLPGKAFWVFYTGLTSLPYTITVTDEVTGIVQSYDNGDGGSGTFCGGADTSTFRDAR